MATTDRSIIQDKDVQACKSVGKKPLQQLQSSPLDCSSVPNTPTEKTGIDSQIYDQTEIQSSIPNWFCKVCNRKFSNKTALDSHMLMSSVHKTLHTASERQDKGQQVGSCAPAASMGIDAQVGNDIEAANPSLRRVPSISLQAMQSTPMRNWSLSASGFAPGNPTKPSPLTSRKDPVDTFGLFTKMNVGSESEVSSSSGRNDAMQSLATGKKVDTIEEQSFLLIDLTLEDSFIDSKKMRTINDDEPIMFLRKRRISHSDQPPAKRQKVEKIESIE